MKRPLVADWLSNTLLLIGAAGVAFLLWSLATENRALKRQLSEIRAALAPPQNLLGVGDLVGDTPLLGLDGDRRVLRDLVDGGGVVVFLTTTCPYCEQTLPTWGQIAAGAADRGLPFVGVSLHDESLTREYAAAHQIEWPLWVLENPLAGLDLNVQSVPYTVLVREGGTVSRAWLGALTRRETEDLLAVMQAGPTDVTTLLSRSPAGDPNCCEAPLSGTDGGR